MTLLTGMTMRTVIAILLFLIGALAAVYALAGLTATVFQIADWVSEGDWSRIAKVIAALAVSGAIAWFSLRGGWRRRADILALGGLLRTVLRMFLRVSSRPFFGMVAGSLVFAALVVAYVVNPIELPDFLDDDLLSWDPTRTARKYLWLAVVAVAGAYLVPRFIKKPLTIAVAPAMMLVIAVPIGIASGEFLRDRWSHSYWILGAADNYAALSKDPYVFWSEGASIPYAVRISQNSLAQLQFLRRTGARGDWSALEEAEAEEAAAIVSRRRSGFALLVVFVGLVAGSGWLIYRDRLISSSRAPRAEPPPESQ